MQFQSDILNLPLNVPAAEELSAIGAAYAAGIALGVFERAQVFARMKRAAFVPTMSEERRREKYDGWKAALDQVLKR